MVITPFTHPTSEITLKSSSCTGLINITEMKIEKEVTDDKGLSIEGKTQPWDISIELEQISSSSSESSESTREEQLIEIRQCSGRKVCPQQRSGELCSPVQCCHMCTGQLSERRFSNQLPEINQHPQTHGQRHSIALESSDTNSDSDEQFLSGWHDVEEQHRLRFHEHNEDETEVDHGGHGRVNPFNQPLMNQMTPFHQILDYQTPDVLEVEDFQYSVQETSSNLSKSKEAIVFGKEPLLLQKEEKHKRPCNVKHVFSRPFVCNMPPFVGEQYM